VSALLSGACGCLPLEPVAGPPWVEHASLALEREDLRIVLFDDATARVEADFHLRGDVGGDAIVPMRFPIPPGCAPAGTLSARVRTDQGVSSEVAVRRAAAGSGSWLPAGDVAEMWDLDVPAAPFATGAVLHVLYAQRCTDRFRYTLSTGAYWRGPIGRLDVLVTDAAQRVSSASVEGQPPHGAREGAFWWSFEDVEPRGEVDLVVRAQAFGSGGARHERRAAGSSPSPR
jgi:hypothetical protein